MARLSYSGAFIVFVGAVAASAIAQPSDQERGQEIDQEDAEVEIITEPPSVPESPSTSPPPSEPEAPPAKPEAPPAEPLPKVEPPKSKLGQLRVGAGVGLGFGSNLITVAVAPQVSYIFKKIVEPGVTVRYEYTNDRFVVPNAIWHTFGSSLFVRIYPISSLFFLIEGELINTGFRQGDFNSGRTNYGNLFLGGGYVMGVGRGAFIAVSLKVNVFRNAFYPSNIPIFGIGAGYAF